MKRQIQSNPRLLFWGRAFYEVKMMSVVIVLFYLHRGVSLDQVFYLSIVWSLVALATEIPSGYLADKIGRKRTLMLGVALICLSHIVSLFANGFWPFVGVFVLLSASFSCFSGTDEALLYESLQEMEQEHGMTHHNGRLMSARALFKLFVPLIGAIIAKDLLEWQFQILLWTNIIAVTLAFVFLSQLVEPPRRRSVLDQEMGVFKQSVATLHTHPWLLKAALNKFLVFFAVFMVWRIYQPMLADAGMSIVLLGVFDAIGHIILFSMWWNTGKIAKHIGLARYIFSTGIVSALCLGLSLFTDNFWFDFVLLVLVIGIGSGREPAFAHAVNRRIVSHSRATTLSNLNVIKSILDIPVYLLAGWLAVKGYDYVLELALTLCLVALVFFPLRERELEPQVLVT